MTFKHTSPKLPRPVSTTWAVRGTIPNPDPPREGTYYHANFELGVDAPTMEEAIAVVRRTIPNAVFDACHNRGKIHLRLEV